MTYLGPGESTDTHIVGVLSFKKRKSEKKTVFRKKTDFPDPGADFAIPVHPGMTLRYQEVHRSEKKAKKKNPEKPDFPDPDPEFRISAHGVAIRGPRATCSQNFRPLATVVSELLRLKLIIIY